MLSIPQYFLIIDSIDDGIDIAIMASMMVSNLRGLLISITFARFNTRNGIDKFASIQDVPFHRKASRITSTVYCDNMLLVTTLQYFFNDALFQNGYSRLFLGARA